MKCENFGREKIYTCGLFCLEYPVVSTASFVLALSERRDDGWRGIVHCEEGLLCILHA